MMNALLKLDLATIMSLALPIGGGADERSEATIAVDNLQSTLDPVIGVSATGTRVLSILFDLLVRRNCWENPEGKTLAPWLAESRERTTPSIWTIRLREGVGFHDGARDGRGGYRVLDVGRASLGTQTDRPSRNLLRAPLRLGRGSWAHDC